MPQKLLNLNKKKSDIYQINAEEVDYLYTQKSQIPDAGKGLFTAVTIFKDEIISYFKGELLSKKEAVEKINKNEDAYFINMLDGNILDSMNVPCFAKYANDPAGIIKTSFKSNSKITLDELEQVCLVAKRKIKTGEEIFCAYGKNYWKKYQQKK
ncbi:MAG: SET domain-containing protein-lysine N-methyltransferase [Bacteroidia bacterium]|nr:SET domain-containing protein-lysine N-methyltransferase [Bacteroidia bacterium]